MKSNTQKKPTKSLPPKGRGAGYQLGPRKPKPVSADTLWMTSNQLCARYGNRSHMWIVRSLKNDPSFPKPRYQGRMRLFSVKEFDEYDRLLVLKRSGT
jgi:hypothetical protein